MNRTPDLGPESERVGKRDKLLAQLNVDSVVNLDGQSKPFFVGRDLAKATGELWKYLGLEVSTARTTWQFVDVYQEQIEPVTKVSKRGPAIAVKSPPQFGTGNDNSLLWL